MMPIKYLVIAILFLLFSGCTESREKAEPRKPAERKVYQRIFASLVRLIATPEQYEGEYVITEGYISYKFEDYHLYLTKNDYETLSRNRIHITWPKSIKMPHRHDRHPGNDPRRFYNGKLCFVRGIVKLVKSRVGRKEFSHCKLVVKSLGFSRVYRRAVDPEENHPQSQGDAEETSTNSEQPEAKNKDTE